LKLALGYLIFAGMWVSSTPTFSKWRAKYGDMDVSMMSRMKELEEEICQLVKVCSLNAYSQTPKLTDRG
jgi:hypothetical protein